LNSSTLSMEVLSIFTLWPRPAFRSRDITMYFVLSARFSTRYKIFIHHLLSSLSVCAEEIGRDYQCGFRELYSHATGKVIKSVSVKTYSRFLAGKYLYDIIKRLVPCTILHNYLTKYFIAPTIFNTVVSSSVSWKLVPC